MKNATANNIELCEIVITTKQSKTIIEIHKKAAYINDTSRQAKSLDDDAKKSRLIVNSLKVNYRQKSM